MFLCHCYFKCKSSAVEWSIPGWNLTCEILSKGLALLGNFFRRIRRVGILTLGFLEFTWCSFLKPFFFFSCSLIVHNRSVVTLISVFFCLKNVSINIYYETLCQLPSKPHSLATRCIITNTVTWVNKKWIIT